MYVKYGAFPFEPWEAGLSVYQQHVHSSRGFKQYQRVRYDIDGELCIPTGQYDITTRLNQIITAFSTDGFDIGLYHDDNSPSHHFMSSSDINNLTGNQVIYAKFPVTAQGEYTSGRRFQIGVSALLNNYEADLVEHRDSLHRHSNAGPHWRWRRNRFWGFYPEIVTPNTMQIIHHVGYRVAMSAYPLPVTPFYAQPFEMNHERRVSFTSPRRHPNGYTEYRVDWHYIYRLPTFDDVTFPTTG